MTPDRLLSLFGAGLRDDFAVQTAEGGYSRMNRAATRADAVAHLDGSVTMGFYQLSPEGLVRWLCLDLDVMELEWLEWLVRAALDLGIPRSALLREFSGNKGYHLWVFFEVLLPAPQARRLGDYIVQRSGVPLTDPRYTHPDGRLRQLIEVYPKTVALNTTAMGMGALVKLPLGIHRKSGLLAMPLEGQSMVVPMGPDTTAAVMARVPPPMPHAPRSLPPPMPSPLAPPPAAALLLPGSNGRNPARNLGFYHCTEDMIAAVHGEGARNAALFEVAKRYNVAGFSKDETVNYMVEWATTHTQPPTGRPEVVSTAKQGMKYTGMNCLDPFVVPFCKETCPIFGQEHAIATRDENGNQPRLRVTSTTPAVYTIPLTIGDVIIAGNDIYNWERIREAAMVQLPNAITTLSRRTVKSWEDELVILMVNKVVVETPEVTSLSGLVGALVHQWLRRASDDPAQVARSNVWKDDEDRVYVFYGEALIRFIQQIERGMDRALIWREVKAAGGTERDREIPGEDGEMTVWEIPFAIK